MTSEPAVEDVRVGGSRIVLDPHSCFACGSLNAHGLHLVLHAGGGACWTEVTLDERFQGWDGIAHGGIVCTILDEVMAWALVDNDVWGVTARMNVDFKRPVPIGRRVRGEGRVREARRRVIYAEGVLRDAEDGTELARAEATFVAAPEAKKQALKERYGFRLEPATPGAVDTRIGAGA
ncbi:MAG TPA: PaaI family thioesterase [Candidatus Limnocylindrales bacterium]|nr:PaaI family thioesterase [Candidatus Limnocylindrales bacterium]